MSLPSRLLGANPSIQVSTLLSGSLATPSAKGAFVDGAFQSIATTTGTGSSTTITFDNIPQTFRHLYVSYSARSSTSGAYFENVALRFNTDTGNHSKRYMNGIGTGVINSGGYTTDVHNFLYASCASALSNNYAGLRLWIYDYAQTDKYKNTYSCLTYENNGNGANYEKGFVQHSSSAWQNTNAITRIDIVATGNFDTSSRFSLYGVL